MSRHDAAQRPRGPSTGQRGLSLVEVLVAGLISSMVLLSIYFVFVTNTENFYRQEQTIQVQERMRFALEYLKNDLRNAGRLAVVNGDTAPPDQVQGVLPYRAVTLFEDDPTVPVLFNNDNQLRPDRIRLLVDASGAAPLVVRGIFGPQVQIQERLYQVNEAGQSLLRDGSQASFSTLYGPGSLAYIRSTQSGKFAVAPVEQANFNGGVPELVVNQIRPLGLDAECGVGACLVNPVHLVEYAVLPDADDPTKTNLVRRRLNPDTEEIIGDPVVIAEYVVNLQVWGTYDSRDVGSSLAQVNADEDPRDDVGNWPTGGGSESARMNQDTQRLRAFNVLLAVRSPREDDKFTTAPDRATAVQDRVAADRTWFEVDPAQDTGLARVATMVSEVEAPNLNRGGL